MDGLLFNQSSINGHLDGFHLLSIVNYATVNAKWLSDKKMRDILALRFIFARHRSI